MGINNNGSNYKLHEFSGDAFDQQRLKELYLKFWTKSKPLPTRQARTLSDNQREAERYFTKLIESNKIYFVSQSDVIIGFIAFDFQLSSLSIPHSLQQMIQSKPQNTYCEFVFAASSAPLTLLKKAAFDIFQLLKRERGILYIVGNINREHKKNKYIKTIQRVFGFRVFQDFAFYEIP